MTKEKYSKQSKGSEKTYPKDEIITATNALVELAKSSREMRNHFRSIPRTEEKGRLKVASWVTGIEFRDLLKTLKRIEKILITQFGIKQHFEAARIRKTSKAKGLEKIPS